jgi:hypothetical protein
MKRLGKIAVCLAGGLALNAGLHAASPAASPALVRVPAPPAGNPPSGNPYATIAVRNIFGLNPPAPPKPPEDPAKDLPKITPTGIMGVFGHFQVLFKVAPVATKGGPPPKNEFYILSEGQRQDDIEVVKIDEQNSLVTFDNHGLTQELPLAAAAASPGGGAAATSWSGGGGGMNPGLAAGANGGGGSGGPGGFTRFGSGPGGNNGGKPNSNPGFNNGGNPNGANSAGGGMDFNTPVQGRPYQPEASTMTPQQTTEMIESQRALYMAAGNPISKLLPPTSKTQETIDLINGGGGNQATQGQ